MAESVDSEGEAAGRAALGGCCRYAIEFGRDELGLAFVEVRAQADLPLVCQRSLKRFDHSVRIVQRLGLIADEAQEAALPPDTEPVLVPADGMLAPVELIEDELLLALPAIPVAPGTEALDRSWSPSGEEAVQASPFAALSQLKKNESQ